MDLTRGPFRSTDLDRLGMTRWELQRALEAGTVKRVFRGVYLPARMEEDLGARLAAARLVLGHGHIACDRTAAWIHGIDVHRLTEHAGPPALESCVLRDHTRTRLTGIRGMSRDLRAGDVQELGGIPVTTPLRTALDLGCALYRRDALGALDQFRRRFGLTVDDLLTEAERFRGRRGVRQLRVLIPVSDPRAESLRESWTRLAILDAGLPAPVPQFWWRDSWRLDLAYPRHRVAVEYDGEEFHLLNQAQQDHDRRRRRALAEDRWSVVVVRNGDFSGPRLDAWIRRLGELLRERSQPNRRW